MKQGYLVKELADFIKMPFKGNPDLFISGVSTLEKANNFQLAFLIEEKYFKASENTKAGCLLVSEEYPLNDHFTYLISSIPRQSMAKLLELFSYKESIIEGIHHQASISENVSIGINVSINPFVFIGKNVSIGRNVTILPNSYIGDNVIIGEQTLIYPNVTVMANSVIGKKVIIHSGTVIGSDGYGFVQLDNNYHYKVPQAGNVIIEDEVEIGSNVSIDKATIGSTVIGEGSKIDNLVHIAHNVNIGKRTLIVAQVGIAGSTKIGDDCILAGQAGIAGHIELGNGTLVLGRSGVTKNFPPKSKISGFPAREHKDEIKAKAQLKKIPEIINEIKQLKERLEELEHLTSPENRI